VAEAELTEGRELPSASRGESVRFTLAAMLPNLVQGLFRRRRKAVRAATKLNVDRRGIAAIGSIRRSHGPGPVWVRAGGDRMLLLLGTEDVRRALDGSPEPFAPDPDAKRRGMTHFQPDALTISRGGLWQNRRRFAESVLDSSSPVHRLGDEFVAAADQEVGAMLDGLPGGELHWDSFQRCGWRITRTVVLGRSARDDEELTDQLAAMMDEANKLPKEDEASEHLEPFLAGIRRYIEAAEPGSLVSMFGGAPADGETRAERQVTHWLFAMGDTLFINLFRALAAIAGHPRQRQKVKEEISGAGPDARGIAGLSHLEACLQEAMRLWPTTPLLSRETLEETEWDGATVPAGTQVLISNTFNHRDRQRHEGANRFEPEAWTHGDRGNDWSLNHFSHGPQGCPGTSLALLVGKATLVSLLRRGNPRLLEPALEPGRSMPEMLDFFRIRFAVD
jgi:cytochrome P450